MDSRCAAQPLLDYPGTIPASLDAAYRCQQLAIDRWPDDVVGWKVGWIPAKWQPRLGEERLVGPVFRRELRHVPADGTEIIVPVFAGGFGAIEAEYAFQLACDAATDKLAWSPSEAAEVVGALHVGVEIASSPLASINRLGPTVVVTDFGNQGGLLVGPKITDWSPARDDSYTCRTEIDGRVVGRGGSGRLVGGPLGALAFALGRCARLGRPLRADQWVTTGASTGIHDIVPGQTGRIVFDGLGEIGCRAVARLPQEQARPQE